MKTFSIKKKKHFLSTNKIKGKFFRACGIYLSKPFFNDGIRVMQPHFGDEAARSSCKSRGFG